MKNNEGVGWCLIPPDIVCRTDLSSNEKLVIGRIHGLCLKHGYCYASNRWLAKQFGLSAGTISNIVSSLVVKGLIQREIIRDKNMRIIQRKLYTLSMQQWIPTHSQMEESSREKSIRDNVYNDPFPKSKRDLNKDTDKISNYLKNDPSDLSEVNDAIRYYLYKHQDKTDKVHPKISRSQYQFVRSGFENPTWILSNRLCYEDFQKIIDNWFWDENVKSDYNIIHFASGDTISYHAMKENLIDDDDNPWQV
ncbi:MAG: helix-turn-helix domain-containing protein [Patescibacteria group bacterium]